MLSFYIWARVQRREEAAAAVEGGCPALVGRGEVERVGTWTAGTGTLAEGASGREERALRGLAHGASQEVGPWDASPWEQAPLDVACQEEASYQTGASYLQWGEREEERREGGERERGICT